MKYKDITFANVHEKICHGLMCAPKGMNAPGLPIQTGSSLKI